MGCLYFQQLMMRMYLLLLLLLQMLSKLNQNFNINQNQVFRYLPDMRLFDLTIFRKTKVLVL
jgi:hypothetical protein